MISDKIKSQGELHKGYIVGMRVNDYYNLCVDIYYDKIFKTVEHVLKDDLSLRIYKVFCKRYIVKNSNVFLKGIPIDIYIYKKDVYLDFESIDEVNLLYETEILSYIWHNIAYSYSFYFFINYGNN